MRDAYARVRDEVGEGVTVVVATKYVGVEELGALAEAGVEVVGDPGLNTREWLLPAARRLLHAKLGR